jgi:hypothetical protein
MAEAINEGKALRNGGNDEEVTEEEMAPEAAAVEAPVAAVAEEA